MGTHFRNSVIMKVIYPLLLIVLTSMHVSNGQVTFVRDPGTWTLTAGGRYLDCDSTSTGFPTGVLCVLKCPPSRKLDVRRRTATRIDLGCYGPTFMGNPWFPAAGIEQEVRLMGGWKIGTETITTVETFTNHQCNLPCAGDLTYTTKMDAKSITEITCDS